MVRLKPTTTALGDSLRGGVWLKSRGLDKFQIEQKTISHSMLIPHFWQARADSAPVIIVLDSDQDSTNPFRGISMSGRMAKAGAIQIQRY